MQVGIIAPIKYLRRYCVTSLQLCYTSILTIEPEYASFYQEQREEKKIVILDHSPRLPRKPVNSLTFCGWVQALNPQLVVLPNFDFDSKKTVSASSGFLSQYGTCISRGTARIGVLQGVNLRGVKDCAKGLRDICEVWGLPCSLESIDSRDEIVKKLELDKPIVYLEVNKDPLIEKPLETDTKDKCLGITTSYPLRLAYEGRGLGECSSRPKSLDFNQQTEVDPGLAKKNVIEYIRMVK